MLLLITLHALVFEVGGSWFWLLLGVMFFLEVEEDDKLSLELVI